jgi:hypothetical protein
VTCQIGDAHHRHVDPPIQKGIQGVQTLDLTHTDQHEEIKSQIWETPLVEQIAETDKVYGTLTSRIDLH